MKNSALRLVAPTPEKRTVAMPVRKPNAELRTREYLTEAEVEKLIEAAQAAIAGHPRRDHDPGCLPPRPALERTDGSALGPDRLQSRAPCMSVGSRRARRRRIRSWATSCARCDACNASRNPKSPFVFTSERGAPFGATGFARMLERAGEAARFGFKAHPHMLRHACGFALANKGHDTRALQAYLGHKSIQHTVRYTELAPTRFKDFWR